MLVPMFRGSALGALSIALLVACSFGSPGGKGESAASIADTADDDGGSVSDAADDGGETAGSAGTSTGTGGPGGGTYVFDTGDPVDPDTADTGPIGSTSLDLPTGTDGPVDPTVDPTADPTSEGTDDGTPPDPSYPACPSGQDSECGEGSNCAQTTSMMQVTGSVCGETGCKTGADCPAPTGGTAQPFCADLEPPTCVLGCNGGTLCPGGMTCVGTQVGDVCVWGS